MPSPEDEVHLAALADARLADWSRRPPGGAWQDNQHRRDSRAAARREAAVNVGRGHRSMPVEQVELLARVAERPLRGIRALGMVGDALEALSQDYLQLRDGHPVVRYERLLEFQEVRRRVMDEQLACWAVARDLLRNDPFLGSHPRLDWPVGLAASDPHLHREVIEGHDPLIDEHVHLGGVLGSLDLWRYVLDPRASLDRFIQAAEKAEGLDQITLNPQVQRRLRQARG